MTPIDERHVRLNDLLTTMDTHDHEALKHWLAETWPSLVSRDEVVDHSRCVQRPATDFVMLGIGDTAYFATDDTAGTFDLPPVARAVAVARLRTLADLLESPRITIGEIR